MGEAAVGTDSRLQSTQLLSELSDGPVHWRAW
jgi:hypothetical protein